jgi:uncharacterized protein
MQLKLSTQADGVLLEVHVVPRAKRSAIVGAHDGRLKVALCAPPVDGEANAALVALFADLLGCPKRDVTLVRGDTSRQKTLFLRGVSVRHVEQLLPARS